ncbi:MAG: hypothetical protein LUD72_14650 [Bacteroidales bacterium]|nr:hypothetical protein [Bacteroidales bacterium]
MATIESSIALNDQFSGILENIIDTVNMAVSAIGDMQSTMDEGIDTSSLTAMQDSLADATIAVDTLKASMGDVGSGIQACDVQQQKFNKSLEKGANSANSLQSSIGKALKAFLGAQGIKTAVNWIEDCVDAYNEALNYETQLITVLANNLEDEYVSSFLIDVDADTTSAEDALMALNNADVTIQVQAATDALQTEMDQISEKAAEIQSEGIYTSTAMTAAAGEFATYFSDVNAITSMMDTLSNYAIGMSGVVELSEKEMVDYATNLGKIMTGSYDAMTKKGFKFSDAQKAIIEGTATQQQIVEELGEEYLSMSEDMQAAAAIADVINESWDGLYETMSNTPEGKVIQLTNAFDNLKQAAGAELSAGVQAFAQIIWDNWPTIEAIVNGITSAMEILMGVISLVMQVALDAAQVIIDNWDWLSVVIGIVAAGFAAYYATQLLVNTATTIWNAICSANPLVIILMAIVAAVALVAYVISNLSSTTSSAFGVITGAINVAIQFFKNLGLTVADIALGIVNAIGALCTNIQTAFGNAIANVQIVFYNLLATAMEVISKIAEALNKLPFVSFDAEGLMATANSYANKAAEIEASKGEYVSIGEAFADGFSTYETFADGWISDAYEAGSSWGDSVVDSVTGLFDDIGGTDYSDYVGGYSAGGLGGYGDMLDDIGKNTGSTAGSAADIADHLDVTDEELKYLRDIAEKDTINRFTTAEVKIDQTNNNTFSQGMDFDIILDNLTDMMDEAVDIATAGVHA